MFDWDKLKSKLKCCACDGPMVESEFVNAVMLNKFAEWKSPSWVELVNFVLGIEAIQRVSNRASAILCNSCLENKKKPKYAIEFKFKNGELDKVIYHEINKLKDADPIDENDLVS